MASFLNKSQSNMIKELNSIIRSCENEGWLCEGAEWKDNSGNYRDGTSIFNNEKEISAVADYDGNIRSLFVDGDSITEKDKDIINILSKVEGEIMKIAEDINYKPQLNINEISKSLKDIGISPKQQNIER